MKLEISYDDYDKIIEALEKIELPHRVSFVPLVEELKAQLEYEGNTKEALENIVLYLMFIEEKENKSIDAASRKELRTFLQEHLEFID